MCNVPYRVAPGRCDVVHESTVPDEPLNDSGRELVEHVVRLRHGLPGAQNVRVTRGVPT